MRQNIFSKSKFLFLFAPTIILIASTIYFEDLYYLILSILTAAIGILWYLKFKININLQPVIHRGQKAVALKPLIRKKVYHSLNLFRFTRWQILAFIGVVFCGAIICAIYSAILIDQTVIHPNLLWQYYLSVIAYLYQKPVITLTTFIPLLIISSLIIWIVSSRKFSKFFLAKTLVTSLLIYLMAWAFSAPAFFGAGIFYNNWLIYSKKADPNQIIWGASNINKTLNTTSLPPNIFNAKENLKAKVIDAYLTDQPSFLKKLYQDTIVRNGSKFVAIKIDLPPERMALIDNNLYIVELNNDDLNQLSPILGQLYVKNYLKDRYVKDVPTIKVLGRQEYLSYREEQINKEVTELEEAYTSIKAELNRVYSIINQAKQKIADNISGRDDSISNRDQAYEYCRSAGYYSYYFGYFYRTFTDAECDLQRARWDSIIADFEQNIRDWQSDLAWAQGQAPLYKKLADDLEGYIQIVKSQKNQTVYELGIFEPPNTVKVALDLTSSESAADYISTLVHEYFHYTSYVSEEKQLPRFFEEAITEYLARKAVKQQLMTSTNLGYPLFVKFLEHIIKDIPEEKLTDIYLNKKSDELIAELNLKYGEKFYSDSELYFKILPYLSSEEQLKILNTILFRIDGEQLHESDAQSVPSKLTN